MLVETVLLSCAGGAVLCAITGIFAAAKSYDAKQVVADKVAAVVPVVAEAYAAYCEAADKREMALFRDVSSAWWLDPNRWGDKPPAAKEAYCGCGYGRIHHVSGHDAAIVERDAERAGIKAAAVNWKPLPCPNCRTDEAVIVLNTAGDEVTMWHCGACMAEFTKKGETSKSKRQRKLRGSSDIADRYVAEPLPDYKLDMPLPPAIYSPGSVFDYMDTDAEWKKKHRIETHPCGCRTEERLHSIAGPGYSYTRCMKCRKWWEPPSKGPHSEIAQGEHVHDRDDTTPDAVLAWERATKIMRQAGSPNHGSCPNGECNFPVAKSGAMYYCTNRSCDNHKRRWK